MNQSLAYILAASIRELFPDAEIDQIVGTEKCFFCDLTFPGEFETSMMPVIEERMRANQNLEFQVLTMMPRNAGEMLEHHGEKKLAQKVRRQEGEITLLQVDRFFFQIEDDVQVEEVKLFKLVCFWPLKRGIRLIGVGAASKEAVKELAQIIKGAKNPQDVLEEKGYVSWIGEHLVWKPKREIREKILELYQGFDEVILPELDEREQRKLLLEWTKMRKRGGFQIQKKRLMSGSKEPWDVPNPVSDLGWGAGHINSYLHLITKFLTIFTFDYKIVSMGKIDAAVEKSLKDLHLKWESWRGNTPRLEFQVMDSLGRRWTMSTLEWDRKQEFVQMQLCVSFERCVALSIG